MTQNHLLLIEPHLAERNTLADQLVQLGYRVSTARSKRQALNLVAAKPHTDQSFDLILLGPGVRESICEQLLSQFEVNQELRHTAQLVILEVEDLDSVAHYIELGAEDYLRLPFNPVLWQARLTANLNKKRLHEQELARQEQVKNTVLPLLLSMSQEKDVNRLFETIVIETKALCHADAGTLYFKEDDTLKFTIMRTDSLNIALGGSTGQDIPFAPLPLHDKAGQPNERNVATYVALRGQLVNIADVYDTDLFDFSATRAFDKKNGYRSKSSLTIPLKNHLDEVIGVLQLFNATNPTTGQVVPFSPDQQQVVETLAYQAAIVLNNQILLERQQSWLKFERDLQIGHQIQIDFLPKELPEVEGWEIAARFFPAREVAGDFYDVFALPGNKIGLVVADVCDKGVGPALFMALSRTLVRAFAEQHRPLSWMEDFSSGESTTALNIDRKHRRILLSAGISALVAVELANNYITCNHGDMNMFVTMFLGILDPATGTLTYVNGGHDSPAIIATDGTVKNRLKPTGPAVGMLPGSNYDIEQVKLEPGELLMAFSDGVPDARNPEGKRFLLDNLFPLLAQSYPSVEAMLDQVQTSLFAHIATADQFDDITMLAVRRC